MAVPGRYTVKLTAGGKTMTAPLIVKMDPNVKASTADLERQFQAASKLTAGIGEYSAAVQSAEDLQKQITARTHDAEGNAELATALADLQGKVSAVTGSAAGGGFGGFGFSIPGKNRQHFGKSRERSARCWELSIARMRRQQRMPRLRASDGKPREEQLWRGGKRFNRRTWRTSIPCWKKRACLL